jgi:peptidoglycan/xylan/chitin deacetylase (PgdA/CDA1 family)
MYRDLMGFRLSVTPENFHAQMDWLAANGYHPVDFNDLRAYFAGSAPLPGKPVVITFDDGYRDLYTTAFPILRSHNFKAVAYIVTSFVGQPRYVTAEQILEMDGNRIEIASHTVDHADLARTSPYWANYQLAASRKWLEHLVGHTVVDFAYPSGKFNLQTVAALQATGYDTAVTEYGGTVHSRGDRYAWTRIRVGGGELMPDFIQNLGPPEPWIDITAVSTRQAAP